MTSLMGRIRSILMLLAGCMFLCGVQVTAQDHAPLPAKLVSARRIYLVNDSGDQKAYDTFYRQLRKWGRFSVVTSKEVADIVAVLTSSAAYTLAMGTGTAVGIGNMATATGSAISVPSTSLHLKIFDGRTAEPLWSDSTEKWITSGHAPSALVDHLRKRMSNTK